MLEINNINVKVEEKVILHDFNLTIKDGEIHALMGPRILAKRELLER